MPQYALGVDYGTNSVRALIVDCSNGDEVGTGVFDYPSGEKGVLVDASDPNLARQHPDDYLQGFFASVRGALGDAQARRDGFDPEQIVGIGVDATGSSPLPIDDKGVALGTRSDWESNLDAQCWLWKDHTSFAEASEITEKAHAQRRPYLNKCGGTYSSEWFWSKILHCARVSPDVFAAAHSWIELQDFVPAFLTGRELDPVRGACAAGHKAMFHPDWDGLPSEEFLISLDPRLGELRSRLYETVRTADQVAGGLVPDAAARSGLREGTAVAVGLMDAHAGAVGSGVKPGTLVKIMGTSTCDLMVGEGRVPDIPGVCGVVPGSVIPGMLGIEAGQSAVGDLFNWCTEKLAGGRSQEELNAEAARLRAGESGLIALDWNNGNRTVLVDPLLSGLLMGQTLHTTPVEIYRAMVEATAFGARMIIERIEDYGVKIEEIVTGGGIAEKSPMTMQIYADVCNRPIKLSRSSQTCALGAAVFGAVAGGAHKDTLTAIHAMTGVKDRVYVPDSGSVAIYERLFRLYKDLHDAFAVRGLNPDMTPVMKELIAIRREVRGS